MSDEPEHPGPEPASGSEPLSRAARCLPDDQLLALQSVAPGRIPDEVAAHLASCERCQRRALFGASEAATLRARNPPSLQRAFLLIGVILAALVLFLVSLKMLVG
jgi:hypothetical protein